MTSIAQLKQERTSKIENNASSQMDSWMEEIITIEIEPEDERTENRPGLGSDLTSTVKFRSVEPNFWSKAQQPIDRSEASTV